MLEHIKALEKTHEETVQQARARRGESARQQSKLNQALTLLAVADESLRSQKKSLQRERSAVHQLKDREDELLQESKELQSELDTVVARFVDRHLQVEAQDADGTMSGATEKDFDAPSLQLARAHHDSEIAEIRYQKTADQIGELEAHLNQLFVGVAEANEAVAQFEREALSPARTRVAVARESLRSQQSSAQRETNLLEQADAQISAREKRIEELLQEEQALADKVLELRSHADDLDDELGHLHQQIQPAEEEMTGLAEEQKAKQVLQAQAQQTVQVTESHYNQALLEASRCQDALNSLSHRIEEDIGLVELELVDSVTAQTPLPLKPSVSALPIVEILPEGIEDDIKRLKSRLRRIRSVNPNAPEEYAEAKGRYDFLVAQLADLKNASSQLHGAVTELDSLIETSFRETYTQVAAEFSDVFQSLFGGGSARLELTAPHDLLTSGVDIVARPPGKRAQRLALLSGGERSLTAAALLFALLRVSSTPFCVLDEVDAMLDEANIGRFRVLLEEMAQETQFIVITHNRGTVEAADTVYGVSINKDAISQVVSLRLD